MTTPRTPRVRASELTGRSWLNTGGDAITLADLRGRVVILDFWTFCCINCLHVLDELRELEAAHPDELVIIGVHSPKFEHEADPVALAAAVERYDVHHPVLDDPELTTWSAYTARAWPTLVVIDPEGYIVAHLAGEGHGKALGALITELIAEHDTKGTLHRGAGPYVPPPATPGTLRFPAKAIGLPNGNFLVADAGHHSLAELLPDGETLVRRIGSGERGLTDGGPGVAQFAEPNGLCMVPPELRSFYDVIVADTANHALRGVRLSDGYVETIAGGIGQFMVGAPNNVLSWGPSLECPGLAAMFGFSSISVIDEAIEITIADDEYSTFLGDFAGWGVEGESALGLPSAPPSSALPPGPTTAFAADSPSTPPTSSAASPHSAAFGAADSPSGPRLPQKPWPGTVMINGNISDARKQEILAALPEIVAEVRALNERSAAQMEPNPQSTDPADWEPFELGSQYAPQMIKLSSPWDVAWSQDLGQFVVAMAGNHSLWTLDLHESSMIHLAGAMNEGLRDGPGTDAWFAQPSGLAVERGRVWVADSETSALRVMETVPGGSTDVSISTAIGQGLFDFGLRDGEADQALMQHPLGVAVLPDGSVVVADTYNGAIRRYSFTGGAALVTGPAGPRNGVGHGKGHVTTLATGLAEPSDVVVLVDGVAWDGTPVPDGADLTLLVVESAAHRLTRLHIPRSLAGEVLDAGAHRTQRPVTDIAPGILRLEVPFIPAPGHKLDNRFGPSTQLQVSASPPELLLEGFGVGTDLTRDLVINPAVTQGVLHVSARAASCDELPDGADPEEVFPACHLAQQDWGVPVRVTTSGDSALVLPLLG